MVPSGSTPRWVLAWACGSRSTTHTRFPARARAAARLTVVVVFPTPPFWLITAIRRMPWPSDRVAPCRVLKPGYNHDILSPASPTAHPLCGRAGLLPHAGALPDPPALAPHAGVFS